MTLAEELSLDVPFTDLRHEAMLNIVHTANFLALAGEACEFGAGLAGAKQAGGTRRGALGALIGALAGGIVGTFFIPLLGSLVGACVGAALGAWALELTGGRSQRASLKSGVGAGVGRLAGTLAKLGAGIVIWLMVAVAAFWP